MATQVVVRWIADGAVKTGSLPDLEVARAAGGAVWVDVCAADEPTLTTLAATFDLHALAIEDALHDGQRPKVDVYPSNLFITWIWPQITQRKAMQEREIDVFLGANYLITTHNDHIQPIEDATCRAGEVLSRGAEWALHSILDRSVDDMLRVTDAVGDELESIEDALMKQVADVQVKELHRVRRMMLRLHRVAAPERDALRNLARHEQYVSQDAYEYFQDVGDHVARVLDSIDTYRDVAASAMDIYLSAVSNRLNVVMKQLTVVATIFMPLTLITGVYGMNLTNGMWPSTESAWGFYAVIGSFVVITLGMLYLFRRRGWW